MPKLIVCLGYHLQPDNSINPILKNRLQNVVGLCHKNKNATLLLMGSSPYQKSEEYAISEASVMKDYLIKNFSKIFKDIKILTEENTTSTIEQLCYLKKIIEKEKFKHSDLIIISSKFFTNRVKLYTEYVFGAIDGIIFIESTIPEDLVVHFQKVEENKLKQAKEWLKNHKKGDDKKILAEQKNFQNQVKKGKINQPVS